MLLAMNTRHADQNSFGSRLKWARKNAKLTQKQVCDAVAIAQGTLSELENDLYESSTYTTELADLYKVNALWLATGKGSHFVTKITQVSVDDLSLPLNNQPDKIKKWSEISGSGREALATRFLFRLDGDLMQGSAGTQIPNGALITVDPQFSIKPGCVYLASIDGHPIVGTLSQSIGRLYLRPSNPQYQAVEIDEKSIVGVVTGYKTDLPH